MKITGKSKSGFFPDDRQNFELIENKLIIRGQPEERFEHWGVLVYSDITSRLICLALTNEEKISEN